MDANQRAIILEEFKNVSKVIIQDKDNDNSSNQGNYRFS